MVDDFLLKSNLSLLNSGSPTYLLSATASFSAIYLSITHPALYLNFCWQTDFDLLIHDVIADHQLDVLALSETWIPSDAPDAVKLDVAPPGYSLVHRHSGSSAERRGGGVTVIHRDTVKCSVVDVGDYTQFESLAVKVAGRHSSVVVVRIYRPPVEATPDFADQLADLFDQLMLTASSPWFVTSTCRDRSPVNWIAALPTRSSGTVCAST